MWKDNGKSDDFELDSKQITELIKLSRISGNDIFYDLGSATSRVIIQIAKKENFKRAVGIESEKKHHKKAREMMFKLLSINKIKKIDFWLGEYGGINYGDYDYDITDATIVYNSLNEEMDEIQYYKKQFKMKRVKIIKKDLPLVGYQSKANRSNAACWFFLHIYPLKKIRKKDWISSILGRKGTIEEVYRYYENQLKKRKINKKDTIDSVLELKKLVNRRF